MPDTSRMSGTSGRRSMSRTPDRCRSCRRYSSIGMCRMSRSTSSRCHTRCRSGTSRTFGMCCTSRTSGTSGTSRTFRTRNMPDIRYSMIGRCRTMNKWLPMCNRSGRCRTPRTPLLIPPNRTLGTNNRSGIRHRASFKHLTCLTGIAGLAYGAYGACQTLKRNAPVTRVARLTGVARVARRVAVLA